MGPRNQYYNKLLSHQSVKLNHLLDLDEVGHISLHQEWANMFGSESNCHENDDFFFFFCPFWTSNIEIHCNCITSWGKQHWTPVPAPSLLSPDWGITSMGIWLDPHCYPLSRLQIPVWTFSHNQDTTVLRFQEKSFIQPHYVSRT